MCSIAWSIDVLIFLDFDCNCCGRLHDKRAGLTKKIDFSGAINYF